ncbi:DUF885 domain-containing protein [Alienimonas californiensis]|uniref:DUF885 domain-containing protein n=1 Tax=Alienimonas californiensis TaxID=2527989 RepID=A0A517P454_9PLAN|nr:DUF885 domain-containing protein [Alienimonas californiensis]QDT14125.1 hypothetical protein CA12_01930 [Alienimonas californiensis]
MSLTATPLLVLLLAVSPQTGELPQGSDPPSPVAPPEDFGAGSLEGLKPAEAAPADAAARLDALLKDHWAWTLENFPELSTYLGMPGGNDRWNDDSPTAFARRHADRLAFAERAAAIDASTLDENDALNLTLFRRELAVQIAEWNTGWHLLPVSAREGIQDAGSLADTISFKTVKDYDDWLTRIDAFGEKMDATLALLGEGVETGRLHPQVVMSRLPRQIRAQIVEDPADSLFYKPFRDIPGVPAEDAEKLRAAAKIGIAQTVVPAYQRMLDFFEAVYLPACYEHVGCWQWPEVREEDGSVRFWAGPRCYEHFCGKFTTTDATPEAIHAVGLAEVARIRAEMEAIKEEVGFEGDLQAFFTHLRTDPQFFYGSAQELLDGYRQLIRTVDPELPKLFGTLPRTPYDVQAIPAHIAPDTTTAYYREPSADFTRPGTFFVNLYKPESRPKWEMAALSLHEAVPGHHLQIARSIELADLPAFRKYGGYTAFIEGWALYAEQMGEELGVYDDPYARFGQLTYEMWRAVRLVVDTGMHDQQWTRDEAIDFFLANAPKTRLDVVNEVDRYIAWPGQALAYKTGELKINELRTYAEEELGEDFDVKAFHDFVLGAGAVPLDVLEERVKAWVAEQE